MKYRATILLMLLSFAAARAQTVSHVHASYAEGKITVTYKLGSFTPVDVKLLYSLDHGAMWIPCRSVSGDLHNQTSGDKTIVWRCAVDDVVAGTFVFKVEATSILDLVFVQGGIFIMGCTLEQGGDCNNDERPARKTTVPDFYLGRTEVTQVLWTSVMGGSNPSYWKGDSLPVERVSWFEIQAFLHKLNAKTGMRFRLPTEAEWEYAARGGLKSRGTKYSGSNNASEVGWSVANSGNQTHPVAQKKPNELGLYDMSGNVYEWCSDWYGNANAPANAGWPTSGLYRVYRGGSWGDYETSLRTTHRSSYKPDLKRSYTGFRIAHSVK